MSLSSEMHNVVYVVVGKHVKDKLTVGNVAFDEFISGPKTGSDHQISIATFIETIEIEDEVFWVLFQMGMDIVSANEASTTRDEDSSTHDRLHTDWNDFVVCVGSQSSNIFDSLRNVLELLWNFVLLLDF